MDIQDYYQHASNWKSDKEDQERQNEINLQEDIDHAWSNAREEIKKVFPIDGTRLYKTERDQTSNYPFVGGSYQFYLTLPGVKFTPVYDELRDLRGVIRVVVNCFSTYLFKVTAFYVLVDGETQRFTNPYEAFLACCKEIEYEIEK